MSKLLCNSSSLLEREDVASVGFASEYQSLISNERPSVLIRSGERDFRSVALKRKCWAFEPIKTDSIKDATSCKSATDVGLGGATVSKSQNGVMLEKVCRLEVSVLAY